LPKQVGKLFRIKFHNKFIVTNKKLTVYLEGLWLAGCPFNGG
jgi:hypothetical protein